MRAVGLSDLDAAARALLAAPQPSWERYARDLIEKAHAADLYRKRFGVAHPGGGTGSLCAQAYLHPRTSSSECSDAYLMALTTVLRALQDWRARAPQHRPHKAA